MKRPACSALAIAPFRGVVAVQLPLASRTFVQAQHYFEWDCLCPVLSGPTHSYIYHVLAPNFLAYNQKHFFVDS